jgi:hypothetical protein
LGTDFLEHRGFDGFARSQSVVPRRSNHAGIHRNHLSRVARRSHADSRHREQGGRYTLGRGDARPRISLVGLPVAQASDRAAADGALNACGDQRTERPDGEELLGRAK